MTDHSALIERLEAKADKLGCDEWRAPALLKEAAAALRDLTEQKPKSMGQCAYELMRDFNDNSPAKPNDTTPWDSLSDEVQRSWNEDASRRYRLYGLRRDGTPRDPAIRTKMGLPLPSAPNQAKESGE